MTARDEREALTCPPALYDLALSLLRAAPDGGPRRPGYRSLAGARPAGADPLSRQEAVDGIREALEPLPDDPAELQRRFDRCGLQDRHRHLVWRLVAALPLPAGRTEAVRVLARGLTRSGTSVPAVTAGLALLLRVGEPGDVEELAVLGLFREFTGPAIAVLDVLDPPCAAEIWLAVNRRQQELRPLVRAVRTGDRQAVRAELLAVPLTPRVVGSATARRMAATAQLPDLLDEYPADADLLAVAGRLLVRMGCSRDDPDDLLGYHDALRLYDTVVTRAALLAPTLDHAALLLSLALDLSSGTGVLLDWPSGRREELLDHLGRLLAEPRRAVADTDAQEPEQRRRARWLHRTGRRPFDLPAAPEGLRIEVVSGDPADRNPVETRILIDGRPVVPALFGLGPATRPDDLLDEGGLRAGPEPREVRLAEAACVEECCGALYVTVRRDGDQVVWENWRWSEATPSSRLPLVGPPARRFDAAAYDQEIARAEADCSWSWRARTVARLIKAGLIERPELLTRWDASRGWISSHSEDPDTAVVTFWYQPGLAAGKPDRPDRPLQFCWDLRDDGTPPEAQAAAALRRLAEEDPKSYARVYAGSRERAEELGFTWPYPT
ncbi:hypothetical protein [Kitasatospora sp. NPDC002040]|uniref:hypothetical protein n=1 Tax=Kitasatospora sp. NPDC002040 TaxID=3154661 RepID=UPI00331F8584